MTCECGEKRDLGYGEEWACEACGRRWDTNQIPAEQYDAIRRTQLRFRVLPVVYGVVVASTALFFMLTGNVFSVFVLLPLSMMLWFYFVRPVHRRRYRRAIAELPRWGLRPGLTAKPARARRWDSPPAASRVCPRVAGYHVRSSTTLR